MEKRKQAQNWRLRQARECRGWTQKEVADQIDLPDVRTLRRWETGEASPSLRYRARLCELFAMNAEELGLMPNVDPPLLAQEDPRHNEAHPIPVIFNLASWPLKQQPLATWFVEELHSKYQVPQQVGLLWVENDHILPLLDGLDEVSPALRKACVDAITAYRWQHGLVPLVLRSRREWTRARKNVSSSLITAMFLAGSMGIIGGLFTRFLAGPGFGIIVIALFGLLSFLIIGFLNGFSSGMLDERSGRK